MKIKNITKMTAKAREQLPELEELQRWVKWYRRQGLNILPVKQKEKKVDLPSWTEYQERKATDEEIARWFSRVRNIALLNGKISENSVTIDIDNKKTAKKLFGETYHKETFTVETYNGFHFHFTTDILPESRKYHDYGIEILCEGQIAIMPPSLHESGFIYKVYKGSKKPERNTPVLHIEGDFQEWLYGLIKTRLDKKFEPKRKIWDIDRLLEGISEGERNTAAIVIATFFRRSGLDHEACYEKMMEWNEKNDPPCEGDDFKMLEGTIWQAYKWNEPYGYQYTRQPQKLTVFTPEIRAKAEQILEKGKAFEAINEAAGELHAGDEQIIIVEWISGLSSHITVDKINIWAIGKSQKGKSHSMYTVVIIIPKEYYEVFTSASPLSFFYYIKKYGEWALDKKLIFIDEVEASRMALPMLRSLTGQTPITPRHLSVHDAEFLDLQIKGKRAVWFTSVKTFGSEQIKNRFIHANPDESVGQDDRVWDIQDRIKRLGIAPDNEKFQVAQAIFQNVVENTAKLQVEIPYKIEWAYKKRRWLYPIFVAFIKTITKTNYKQRKVNPKNGKLISTAEDFNVARRLWAAFEKTLIYRVSQSALEILELLSENPKEAMTSEEISREIPLSTRRIRELCDEMLNEGLISSRKRGRAWEYWKAPQPTADQIRLKQRSGELADDLRDKNKNEKKILKSKSVAVSPVSKNTDCVLDKKIEDYPYK